MFARIEQCGKTAWEAFEEFFWKNKQTILNRKGTIY